MPLRHFLTCLDSNGYQTFGFLMFPRQEYIWFIGCVFNTLCPMCAFSMYWSCIAHSHLLHSPLLPLSCIGLYLVSSSQHVMFILCFVAFYFVLGFELHFLIHFAPLMHHYLCSYLHLLPLFLLDHLSIRDKKGESILQRVYQRVLSLLYGSYAHPQGRNFISRAHLQGERYSI